MSVPNETATVFEATHPMVLNGIEPEHPVLEGTGTEEGAENVANVGVGTLDSDRSTVMSGAIPLFVEEGADGADQVMEEKLSESNQQQA